MTRRELAFDALRRAALLLTLAAVGLAPDPLAAAQAYRAPRNVWGQPDLEGLWTNASATRLERPPEAKTLIVPEAEVAALERRLAEKVARQEAAEPVGQFDAEWLEGVDHLARLEGTVRSSWIVSPDDGRLPFTPEGRKRFATAQAARLNAFDGPEARPVAERCVVGGMGAASVPVMNAVAGSIYQIVQTRDAVVIVSETNHDARIIRLGGARLPPGVQVWIGDSVGRWEGETLVVETANFKPDEAFRGQMYLSAAGRVTERFTRVGPGEIRYEFTVEDPATYTAPWRAEMPFRASPGPLLEFACHEGNYSLPGALAGARYQEAEARGAAQAVDRAP